MDRHHSEPAADSSSTAPSEWDLVGSGLPPQALPLSPSGDFSGYEQVASSLSTVPQSCIELCARIGSSQAEIRQRAQRAWLLRAGSLHLGLHLSWLATGTLATWCFVPLDWSILSGCHQLPSISNSCLRLKAHSRTPSRQWRRPESTAVVLELHSLLSNDDLTQDSGCWPSWAVCDQFAFGAPPGGEHHLSFCNPSFEKGWRIPFGSAPGLCGALSFGRWHGTGLSCYDWPFYRAGDTWHGGGGRWCRDASWGGSEGSAHGLLGPSSGFSERVRPGGGREPVPGLLCRKSSSAPFFEFPFVSGFGLDLEPRAEPREGHVLFSCRGRSAYSPGNIPSKSKGQSQSQGSSHPKESHECHLGGAGGQSVFAPSSTLRSAQRSSGSASYDGEEYDRCSGARASHSQAAVPSASQYHGECPKVCKGYWTSSSGEVLSSSDTFAAVNCSRGRASVDSLGGRLPSRGSSASRPTRYFRSSSSTGPGLGCSCGSPHWAGLLCRSCSIKQCFKHEYARLHKTGTPSSRACSTVWQLFASSSSACSSEVEANRAYSFRFGRIFEEGYFLKVFGATGRFPRSTGFGPFCMASGTDWGSDGEWGQQGCARDASPSPSDSGAGRSRWRSVGASMDAVPSGGPSSDIVSGETCCYKSSSSGFCTLMPSTLGHHCPELCEGVGCHSKQAPGEHPVQKGTSPRQGKSSVRRRWRRKEKGQISQEAKSPGGVQRLDEGDYEKKDCVGAESLGSSFPHNVPSGIAETSHAAMNSIPSSPPTWESMQEYSFRAWCASLPTAVLRSRTAFSAFLHTTLRVSPSACDRPAKSLFPLPVPRFGLFERKSNGSRERKKLQKGRAFHVMIMALNFWYSGFTFIPVESLSRRPSSVQKAALKRLSDLFQTFGSSGETFTVPSSGQRSSTLLALLSDLTDFFTWEGLSGDAYFGFQGSKEGWLGVTVPFNTGRAEELRPYRSLDPSRLRLHGTAAWDPRPYLPPDLWMAYNEPDSILYTDDYDMNDIPCVEKECPEKVLQLAWLWDINGLLYLRDKPVPKRCIFSCMKVFNNYKDSQVDRQITDRRGRNQLESKILGVSRGLPSGQSISQLEVKRDQNVIIYCSDRRDFYHQLKVPERKAEENVMYPPISAELLRGTKAFEELVNRRKKFAHRPREEVGDGLGGAAFVPKNVLLPESLYVCFNAVGQGDHLGVEHATAAHRGLLKDRGLLRFDTELRGDRAYWGSDVADGLVIDDYYIISLEKGNGDKAGCGVQLAQSAYEENGILGSPHKDIIAQQKAKLTGAELDASPEARSRDLVLLGAPVHKRLALAFVSLQLAKLLAVTDSLLACLVGGWSSALLYRRPFMSIFDRIHRCVDFSKIDSASPKLHKFPRDAAQEIVLLACLCPLISSDLRASISEELYATDASELGGAAVATKLSEDEARALWRCGKKKGGAARMLSRHEALVQRVNPDWHEENFIPSVEHPAKPLAFRFHFIEVCGGAGKVTAELSKRGWVCGPIIDLDRSRAYNLGKLEVILWLIHMIEEGLLDSLMLEPPCTTFSGAAHPCLRSYRNPRGFNPRHDRTLVGTTLALRALSLMYLAAVSEVAALLEQPLRSKMAWLKEWVALLELGLCHEEKLASCMFGSPHMKEFRLLAANMMTNNLARRCDRSHSHIPIQGKWTKPSAVYTDALAAEFAEAFDRALVFKLRKEKLHEHKVEGLENPLVNDMLLAKKWTLRKSWRWKGSSHINVLEAATVGKLVKELACERPRTRFSLAVDSNVTLCAMCKGRSPSGALKPILRRIGACLVVGCLHPSLHFAPTRLNPSDPPSRGRELDWPTMSFFGHLGFFAMMEILEKPGMRRFAANWVRLSFAVLSGFAPWLGSQEAWRFSHWKSRNFPVRYAIKGPSSTEGYLEAWHEFPSSARLNWISRPDHSSQMDFDSTLGFPGEGPSFVPVTLWIFLGLWIFGLWISRGLLSRASPSLPLMQRSFGGRSFGVWWFVGLLVVLCPGARAMECGSRILMPRDAADIKRAALRGSLELQSGRPVTGKTQDHRDKLLRSFGQWLRARSMSLADVIDPASPIEVEQINLIVERYGRELFAAGRPYGHYSETINAITARRPKLKRVMQGAWDLAYTWLREEPPVHHVALPWQLLTAMIAASFTWGWIREAGVLALSWGGLTRIGEVFSACCGDLLLPRDVLFTTHFALLQIREPKTRYRGARHQVARADHLQLLQVIDLAFMSLNKEDKLWPFSPQTMRLRFQKLLKAFDLHGPVAGSKGLDLGSLRAGGASWLLLCTEDASAVQRRGRWLTPKIMEIYVQEVSSIQFLQKLTPTVRDKVLQGVAVDPFGGGGSCKIKELWNASYNVESAAGLSGV